jgi:hypothetical protein
MPGISGLMWISFRLQLRGSAGLEPASFIWQSETNSLSSANFVGCVVGFLNVCKIRLRSLLLAVSLSFEIESLLSGKQRHSG